MSVWLITYCIIYQNNQSQLLYRYTTSISSFPSYEGFPSIVEVLVLHYVSYTQLLTFTWQDERHLNHPNSRLNESQIHGFVDPFWTPQEKQYRSARQIGTQVNKVKSRIQAEHHYIIPDANFLLSSISYISHDNLKRWVSSDCARNSHLHLLDTERCKQINISLKKEENKNLYTIWQYSVNNFQSLSNRS